MKKLFAKLKKKVVLSFTNDGVQVRTSEGKEQGIDWNNVVKLVFVKTFEEYSGYFLTDEYKDKELYNDIRVECKRNTVKIRTGGSPTVKNNTAEPFSLKFGTTSIFDVAFVEYKDVQGKLNLYAVHFNEDEQTSLINNIKDKVDKVISEQRIEGFSYISKL